VTRIDFVRIRAFNFWPIQKATTFAPGTAIDDCTIRDRNVALSMVPSVRHGNFRNAREDLTQKGDIGGIAAKKFFTIFCNARQLPPTCITPHQHSPIPSSVFKPLNLHPVSTHPTSLDTFLTIISLPSCHTCPLYPLYPIFPISILYRLPPSTSSSHSSPPLLPIRNILRPQLICGNTNSCSSKEGALGGEWGDFWVEQLSFVSPHRDNDGRR